MIGRETQSSSEEGWWYVTRQAWDDHWSLGYQTRAHVKRYRIQCQESIQLQNATAAIWNKIQPSKIHLPSLSRPSHHTPPIQRPPRSICQPHPNIGDSLHTSRMRSRNHPCSSLPIKSLICSRRTSPNNSSTDGPTWRLGWFIPLAWRPWQSHSCSGNLWWRWALGWLYWRVVWGVSGWWDGEKGYDCLVAAVGYFGMGDVGGFCWEMGLVV